MKKIDLKNGEPWLILTDLDGTFYANTPNFSIPAKNVKAVRELTKLGHKFVMASGRGPQFIEYNYDFLGLETPLIAFHGAKIIDNKNGKSFPAFDKKISASETRELLAELDLFDKSSSVHVVGMNKAMELATKEDLEHLDFDVYEIVIMFESNDIYHPDKVEAILENDKYSNIQFKFMSGGSGHAFDLYLFTAKDVDKVHAIKELANHYGIPQERVMFFGDNLNDMKAIEWAGVGVVVESGKDKVKAIADYVAPGTNSEGSVGQFILKLLEK